MKSRIFVRVISASLVATSFGCAATTLRSGAERIIVSHQSAPKTCVFKGQVMGEQGGSLSGGWTSNKNLAQGAMNDMRNKASELGANYVVLEESKAGQTGSGSWYASSTQQTDITQVGNAYLCPNGDIGLGADTPMPGAAPVAAVAPAAPAAPAKVTEFQDVKSMSGCSDFSTLAKMRCQEELSARNKKP